MVELRHSIRMASKMHGRIEILRVTVERENCLFGRINGVNC